jgi:fatty-acyl-CoA synthase
MKTSPEKLALVCIEDDGSERQLSRGELLAAVQRQARNLQSQGVAGGDVFLIVLPHGMDLFTSFWAALVLGAVPVIYAYPGVLETQQGFCEQLGDFVRQIQCDQLLVPAELYADMAQRLTDSGSRVLQPGDSDAAQAGADIEPAKVSSLEQTAILQFSSGTTGAKKGVVISHRAMANYLEACKVTMRLSPDDVVVSWLPLNHDMGLIACFILPLASGISTVIMSPRYWLSAPGALFNAVHRYRGTITMMPNFAFGYCAKSVPDEELEAHDLSCWRLIVSGSEPVQMEVLQAFSRRFSPFGMPPGALSVGYGMAECVLGVSRTPLGESPQANWIEQKRLLKDGKAVPCASDAPGAKAIASCGRPHPMVQVEVVDDNGLPLPERAVGEIRVKSTALFSGYYSATEPTRPVAADEWFHTGDLGYLHEDEVYVCGRKKDMIISFGSNIYPGDIETIAESFPAVRKGRTVAFGVDDERRGTEKIVLLCELQDDISKQERTQLVNSIRERVKQKLDLLLPVIDFVERGWIVKTTSGKLARSANREKYLGKKSVSPMTSRQS